MSEELKPCPFCGTGARTSSGMNYATCSCLPIDTWVPIAAWNRREGKRDLVETNNSESRTSTLLTVTER